jgi:hypothetical protein
MNPPVQNEFSVERPVILIPSACGKTAKLPHFTRLLLKWNHKYPQKPHAGALQLRKTRHWRA